jgi:hypothetical protein
MDMRFGICKVRSLHGADELKTVARELGKCKLDLMGVEVRWENGDTERTKDYTCFYGEGNLNHQIGTGFHTYAINISD